MWRRSVDRAREAAQEGRALEGRAAPRNRSRPFNRAPAGIALSLVCSPTRAVFAGDRGRSSSEGQHARLRKGLHAGMKVAGRIPAIALCPKAECATRGRAPRGNRPRLWMSPLRCGLCVFSTRGLADHARQGINLVTQNVANAIRTAIPKIIQPGPDPERARRSRCEDQVGAGARWTTCLWRQLNTETSGAGYAKHAGRIRGPASAALSVTPGEASSVDDADERNYKQADDALPTSRRASRPVRRFWQVVRHWRDGSEASPTACRNCAARPKGALMRP